MLAPLSKILNLPGYVVLEEIYIGIRTVVYRGIREEDEKPVVIKAMRNEFPTFDEITQFRNQYIITKSLNLPGVIKTYSLENYRNRYALILEDFGGISLYQEMGKIRKMGNIDREKPKVKPVLAPEKNKPYKILLKGEKPEKTPARIDFTGLFLYIAMQICDAIGEIHAKRIIHKDIKPANILLNRQTLEVKIIDFSIASLLPNEVQELTNPEFLEGTLGYISPEQTGRMNRPIDYRTDYYSLGVTLYEFLTGQLPFVVSDSVELVHCHVAKKPELASNINPDVPVIVAEIVNKLMAKNAEDRYQSAIGLKHDLGVCWKQWVEEGEVVPFELMTKDVSDRFMIPNKLYGREADIENLFAAYERASQGSIEVIFVTGESGVGKTAVVKEIHKPVVQNRGYFVGGKFDQFQRDIPFAALTQAIRDFIGQVLIESDAQIQAWKRKILAALGEQGQVIVDIIPELEMIIGKQPPVASLSGSAAQNRFNILFQKLIWAIANEDHPLVLFIDDMQWADLASLKFIKALINENIIRKKPPTLSEPFVEPNKGSEPAKSLLFVGSYRESEVEDNSHPLRVLIREIRRAKARLDFINIVAFTPGEVAEILAQTLYQTQEEVIYLAQVIFASTYGNPFFTMQLIQSLYNQGLLKFNYEVSRWEYDLDAIKALSLTDDVLEFLSLELTRLMWPTLRLLKRAACIGNEFDFKTLTILNQESPIDTTARLWEALLKGMVVTRTEIQRLHVDGPLCDETVDYSQFDTYCGDQPIIIPHSSRKIIKYRFVHDRLQQTAYSLIPEAERKSTHLSIGYLLLENTPVAEREENIFLLVNQFNVAFDLITSRDELDGLAEMNLVAGRKALASTAHSEAFNYLSIGIKALAEDCWEKKYTMALALYETAAEAAYLSGHFEQAQDFIEIVLANAKTLMEKIKVYEIKIEVYKAQSDGEKAIDAGLEVLDLLGIKLAQSINPEYLNQELQKVQFALAEQSIEELADLPEMSDSKLLAVMSIIGGLLPIACICNPILFCILVTIQINISLNYGNCSISALAYATYAIVSWNIYGDIDLCYRFGQLALKVLDKYDSNQVKSKILYVVNTFTKHQKEHIINSLDSLQEAYLVALETGDLEHAAYSLHTHSEYSYWSGKNLIELDSELRINGESIANINQEIALQINQINQQSVVYLLEGYKDEKCLIGEVYNEKVMLPLHQEVNNRQAIFCLHLQKLFLYYLSHNYLQAQQSGTIAQEYLDSVPAKYLVNVFLFYQSLSILAIYKEVTKAQQDKLLETVFTNQRKMKLSANYAPMNLLHKYYLVEAETYRVLGQNSEAMEYYDRAISLAKEYKYVNEEALANELAAKFYLHWGKEKIAPIYITEAYYCYMRWGAKAKVDDLVKCYPDLLTHIVQQEYLNASANQEVYQLVPTSPPKKSEPSTIFGTYTSSVHSLDLAAVLRASQALSEKLEFEELISTLMEVLMENAGATKCVLVLSDGENLDLTVTAVSYIYNLLLNDFRFIFKNVLIKFWNLFLDVKFLTCILFLFRSPILTEFPLVHIDNSKDLPSRMVNCVKRTGETFVYDDARDIAFFAADSYMISQEPKSVLCTPILYQAKLVGVLYLENSAMVGAFTRSRLEVLKLITTQAAIAIENAKLYKNLEEHNHELENKVKSRTQELNEKNLHLQQVLVNLQTTQSQLIQSEKMSSLGQMVAGIAHEINNPINFIHGNISHANDYVNNLLDFVNLYKQECSPTSIIKEKAKEIDVDFLLQDLPKLFESMKVGSSRIRDIVLGLRNFSRLDESEMKPVDIHEGIDNTLMILHHRLKEKSQRSEIEIIKEYGSLPDVNCYPGQLNQVFMNILSNAIDALEESLNSNNLLADKPTIRISTKTLDSNAVKIQITDNGYGMNEDIRQKIFDPFFTTKPIGTGTGLGLSISYQIIVEKHKGQLICNSSLQNGTEFIIQIPI